METIIQISLLIALVILGFIIAEIRNTHVGKSERGTKKIFSIIGIIVTQKDIQRLALSFFVGVVFIILSANKEAANWMHIYDREIFFIVGLTPSTVLHYYEKYFNKKLE